MSRNENPGKIFPETIRISKGYWQTFEACVCPDYLTVRGTKELHLK
jgi:hypothetical protein